MIRRIEYGYEWSDYFRRWTPDRENPDSCLNFDEAYARRRHDDRKQFAMLMDLDDGSRVYVISCEGRDTYFVQYLDARDRAFLRCCFESNNKGGLYLSQYDQHAYKGNDRTPNRGLLVRFELDGKTIVLSGPRPRSERILKLRLDPSFHDAPMPEFGQWEPLIRRRVMPYQLDSRSSGDAS